MESSPPPADSTPTSVIVMSGVLGTLFLLAIICAVDWIITYRRNIRRRCDNYNNEQGQQSRDVSQSSPSRFHQRSPNGVSLISPTQAFNGQLLPDSRGTVVQDKQPANLQPFRPSLRFPQPEVTRPTKQPCEEICKHHRKENACKEKADRSSSNNSSGDSNSSTSSSSSSDDLSVTGHSSSDSGYSSYATRLAWKEKLSFDTKRFVEKICEQVQSKYPHRPPPASRSANKNTAEQVSKHQLYGSRQFNRPQTSVFSSQTNHARNFQQQSNVFSVQNGLMPNIQNAARRRRMFIERERQKRQTRAKQQPTSQHRRPHQQQSGMETRMQRNALPGGWRSRQNEWEKERRKRYAPVIDRTWAFPVKRTGTPCPLLRRFRVFLLVALF
jgi:hypothetical protein